MNMYITLQCSLPIKPLPVGVHCMAFNHNSNLLITGGADGMIRLFGECQSHQVLCRLANASECTCVAIMTSGLGPAVVGYMLVVLVCLGLGIECLLNVFSCFWSVSLLQIRGSVKHSILTRLS